MKILNKRVLCINDYYLNINEVCTKKESLIKIFKEGNSYEAEIRITDDNSSMIAYIKDDTNSVHYIFEDKYLSHFEEIK